MITALYGVLFHWIGGLAAGSFYVPFKKVRNWSWETYWLTNGIVSWLLAPTIFALILTTAPFEAILATDSETLRNTYLGGVCWGVGGLTFGLSIRYLGVGLGNAIALGFCTVFGDLEVLAKAAGVEEVESAAVRGDYIVYVTKDSRGAFVKGVIDKAEVEKPPPAPPKPKPKSKAKPKPKAQSKSDEDS